jgi:hypothetical protein
MRQGFFARLGTLGISLLALGAGASCQGPSGSNSQTPAPVVANEQVSLTKIADAFKKFHTDTGGWPVGAMAWSYKTDPEISPLQLDDHDTALFTMPVSLKHCGDGVTTGCWNGPYLDGKNLGEDAFHDAWGHSHYVTLIRPFGDGSGGGVQSAPDGVVLLWSAGPDGIDQVGCTDGSCGMNVNMLAKGLPSSDKADDVVTVVAKVKDATSGTTTSN